MMKFTETMQCRQYNLLCIMWAPVSCVTCQCTIGCPGQLLRASERAVVAWVLGDVSSVMAGPA